MSDEDQQGCDGLQEKTCRSRLPVRKTVRPLHPSWYASRKAAATSALVAVAGKLMVFETPLSLYR